MSFTIFGIYLVVCTLKERSQKKFEKKYGLKKKEWWLWLNRVITFFLVMIALVFFRANDISDGLECCRKMFTYIQMPVFVEAKHLVYACMGILVVFIAEYIVEYKKIVINDSNILKVYCPCAIGMLVAILSIGVFDGGQFIYFQF